MPNSSGRASLAMDRYYSQLLEHTSTDGGYYTVLRYVVNIAINTIGLAMNTIGPLQIRVTYYCETCWLWWQRHVYDFRLNTLAKTLPDWMLDNEGYRYILLLGCDIRPTELLIRRRKIYSNLLLFANGDLVYYRAPCRLVTPLGNII